MCAPNHCRKYRQLARHVCVGTLLQFLSAMRLLTRGSSRHGKLFPMFLKLHNHTTDNDLYVTIHLAQTISIAILL